MTGAELARRIERQRFRFDKEAELQEQFGKWLAEQVPGVRAEVVLEKGGRIDFLAGDVGIEVKCRGGLTALVRQLSGYAESPRIAELVLATTRVQLCRLPRTLSGKPVHAAALYRGFV